MVGTDSEGVRDPEQERHDDHDRGEDVHHRADDQQDDVDREEEHELRVDVRLRPCHELLRDLSGDHVVGQHLRCVDDDEDRADHRHRLAAHPPQDFQIEGGAPGHSELDQQPRDAELERECVHHGERGDLGELESDREPGDHAERDRELRHREDEGPGEHPRRELRARHLADHRDGDRESAQHADQHQAGHDSGEQKAGTVPFPGGVEAAPFRRDVEAADRAVDEQRKGRREQQPDRARAGDQPDRELLVVASAHERGHQHAAERDDRDTRGAGEHGEQRARQDRDDREAPRDPAERRIREVHEALRRPGLGEQIPGEDEQRDRRHHLGLIAEAERKHARRHATELGVERARQAHRTEDRCAEHDREQRCTADKRERE